MPETFKIITLGCRVNQYESAYLNEALVHSGLRAALKGETADIAIINTCIVTQRASHQSRQAIRKAIRENPGSMVAAVGCYAQVFPEELSGLEGLGLVADNRAKRKLPDLLLDAIKTGQKSILLEDFEPELPFECLEIERFPGRTRANLKIQDGCEAFCSYCVVPFARGPYRSLPPSKVLSMVESLAGQGYREIILTGIHLGNYGVDLRQGVNLKGLLRSLGRERFPVRIRLSSLHPHEIDGELIDMVASESWLCRHFHISLQSGEDGILRRMNRKYSVRDFAALVEGIDGSIPFAAIGVDLITGFPGEDDAAFQNTYSLIKDLPVSYVHVFPFSPRPGTAAFAFNDKVKPEVIRKRAAALRELGQRKRITFYRSCINREFPVLGERWHSKAEKIMQGTSDNYLPVLFSPANHAKGRLVAVNMARVEKGRVIGKVTGLVFI